MRHLYLDYNATTPVAPSVREAMLPFLGERFGNPSSSHALGRACFEAVEDARGKLAGLLGCDAEEIVFTGGGTESNNLALQGIAQKRGRSSGGHIVISAIEHPSVVEPARFLERIGFEVTVVSVMMANNEIGTIQPLKQIAEACRAAGVPFHSDAAQAVGKIRTPVNELGVDLLTIAGHKMYGPKGVGALYVRQGTALEPVLHGAGQEGGLRAGTENVAGIVGLGAAAALAAQGLDSSHERLEKLRDRLLRELRTVIGDPFIVHGERAARLPNTLSVSFPGVSGFELLARVPELCASTGSACHSETHAISPTLAAMGVSRDVARGTVRLSLGWYTTEEDVERAASLLLGAWEGAKGK